MQTNKHWALVYVAGVIEVLWVIGLARANTRYEWVATLLMIVLSFYVLLGAMKALPCATVYAVFTGLGTAGTNIVDMVFFGEAFSWTKIMLIVLLLCGIIGLKLTTPQDCIGQGQT